MRTRILSAVAAIGLAATLAACGGSSATASQTSATTAAADAAASSTGTGAPGTGQNAAALQAWRDCLTKNGVTLPAQTSRPSRPSTTANTDPNAPSSTRGSRPAGAGGGGGFGGLNTIINDPANAAAVAACKSLQPTFGQGGGGQRSTAYKAYLTCLAGKGVTVPTTVPNGPRPTFDTTDPTFQAADAICKALLPAPGAPGSTTTTASN